MEGYQTISVVRKDAVAYITIRPADPDRGAGAHSVHTEIGGALNDLRFDNSVRVIVVGSEEKDFFCPPPGRPRMAGRVPGDDWDLTQGMQRAYQQVLEIEKPVIAKVSGNAAGFGASFVFACDFIVVAEDAVFGDSHLGMGEGEYFPLGRPDSGTAPGDGGNVFVPLYMPPPLAREYLWLAKQFTGKELAAMHYANRAVPAEQLDEAADQLAKALLRRPAYALALSKRAFNRFMADRFNLCYDLAWSYEALNFYQYGRYKDGRGDERL
jgi:enoyl-CoA hydratase/carnithine racemase